MTTPVGIIKGMKIKVDRQKVQTGIFLDLLLNLLNEKGGDLAFV